MIDEKFDKLQQMIQEMDSLVGEILDSEPEEAAGTYGSKIQKLFSDASWIDCCIF